MNFVVHWIDVAEHLAKRQQPIFMLERALVHGDAVKGDLFNVAEVARLGTFWVPTSDLNQTAVTWSKTASGQFVRIPVFAYRMDRIESVLFGTSLQLGMQAMETFRRTESAKITIAHLVLGHQVHIVDESSYRGYLGIALQGD